MLSIAAKISGDYIGGAGNCIFSVDARPQVRSNVEVLLKKCILRFGAFSVLVLTSSLSFSQTGVVLPATTVTKKDAYRQDVRDSVSAGSNRSPVVTSEDRTSPKSAAHDRGAIDIRSKDINSAARHQEATNISKQLGNRGTVVVEEVKRPSPGAAGPTAQVNTSYKNGAQGKTKTLGQTASETHTHVQPDPVQGSGSRSVR